MAAVGLTVIITSLLR